MFLDRYSKSVTPVAASEGTAFTQKSKRKKVNLQVKRMQRNKTMTKMLLEIGSAFIVVRKAILDPIVHV
jgi:hypothetical protein